MKTLKDIEDNARYVAQSHLPNNIPRIDALDLIESIDTLNPTEENQRTSVRLFRILSDNTIVNRVHTRWDSLQQKYIKPQYSEVPNEFFNDILRFECCRSRYKKKDCLEFYSYKYDSSVLMYPKDFSKEIMRSMFCGYMIGRFAWKAPGGKLSLIKV